MSLSRGSQEYEDLALLLPDDFSDPDDTLDEVRAKFDMVHGHDPGDDVAIESTEHGVWVRTGDDLTVDGTSREGTVFFVHGGGFVTSPARTYTFYAANILRACGMPVFIAEYRLAPETIHPGQSDDLIAAYESLTVDVDPASVILMGDSCGGGMALALAVRIRDEGLPPPAAVVSLCGWFDLDATGTSAVAPIGRDPLLNVEWLRRRGRDFVGPDGDPSDPTVSPLHADLHNLPPVLLQAGEVDRCRSDAERLADALSSVGGYVELAVWPAMPHGFHGLVGAIPEADAALEAVNAFVTRWLGE